MYAIEQKIYPDYVSKHKPNCEKQVNILIVPNGKGHKTRSEVWWHYLVVKKLLALLRGIRSKHHGDFSCLNCLHSFAREKCESHKKVCESKDFCKVIMPSQDTEIL